MSTEIKATELKFTPALRQSVRASISRTQRPQDLPGYIAAKLTREEALESKIVCRIDVKPPNNDSGRENRQYCCLCGTKEKFWRGFVIFCPDGSLRTVGGSVCAEKGVLNADEFDRLLQVYELEEARQAFIAQCHILLNQIPGALVELERFGGSEPVRMREDVVGQFRHGSLLRQLLLDAERRRQGRLMVERHARLETRAAEIRQMLNRRASNDDDQIVELVHVGDVQGAVFIDESIYLPQLVRKAMRELEAVQSLIGSDPSGFAAKVKHSLEVRKSVLAARDLMVQAMEILRAGKLLFSGQSLTGISAFISHPAQRKIQGRARRLARGIEWSNGDNFRVSYTLPDGFYMPKLKAFPSLITAYQEAGLAVIKGNQESPYSDAA